MFANEERPGESEVTPESGQVPTTDVLTTRNVLLVTLRQRTALSALNDEKLMRFQMAFNVLVNIVTDGEA